MYTRRRAMLLGASAALSAGAVLALPFAASAQTAPIAKSKPKPTVVLVHGAWADSGSWADVVKKLQKDGYPVRAAANPLRGVANDAAALGSLLKSIEGPVVLVGHSYGGAVISAAAEAEPKVKSLVYVSAFVPDQGETIGDLAARKVSNPPPALPIVPVPTGPQSADLYLDPASFRSAFAADVSKSEAAVMAATQRPVAGAAFAEPATAPARTKVPAWYLVAQQDQAIAPETQKFMAQRAGARVTQVKASHAVMVSRPDAVTKIIEAAAR